MHPVLVGSAALHMWFTSETRKPRDVDWFSQKPIDGAETFWHDRLNDYHFRSGIATPDELYTIKVSHAFWNLHGTWRKHMNDVVFLSRKGAQFMPELYSVLYPIWQEVHGKKPVHLNMTKQEFFADRIIRKYDHDSLHASVAYYDRPIYERILKDGESIAVDRAKWDALSYEDQLKCAREEIYANALERKVIPADYYCSPKGAYEWAVQQTITSLSKGWFALFVVLNYDELRKPDVDYVQVHKDNADKLILLEES